MDLQVRHLAAFVALCEEGTFVRAAARLNVTQPSLTRTIQELERILDCDLAIRNSRRFELTDNGELLLQRSRDILAELNDLRDEIRARSQVRVGFSWLLPTDWFGDVRARYEGDGGRVSLHRSDDPSGALLGSSIDLAIVRSVAHFTPSLAWRRIATEKRVLAVSARSDLARASDPTWNDLADRPLVVNTQTGTTTADSWSGSAPGREIITCTNFDEWIELIASNRGIGAVPVLAVSRAPHPDVVYREVPDIPDSYLYLAWRRRPKPSRSVRRFLDTALAGAADAP